MSTPSVRLERWALVALVFVHLGALWAYFPPGEAVRPEPLRHVDHPVHAFRVHVYRAALQESGLPWGYDPAVAAGLILQPAGDLGAKPQQVLGVLLPFLSAGAVVRLFLLATIATMPLWLFLACRDLGLERQLRIWPLIVLVAALWLHWTVEAFLKAGLVAFVAASSFAPYVLTRFLVFLRSPRVGTWALFVVALSVLTLLHAQGPWVLALPLAAYTLLARPLPRRWRWAAVAAAPAALAVNAFWIVPFVIGRRAPAAPVAAMPALDRVSHLTYASWSELMEVVDPVWVTTRILGLALLGIGFVTLTRRVGRRPAIAFGLAALFVVGVKYFGSFIPVVESLQPMRFVVPAVFVLALPLGVGVAALIDRCRIPVALSSAGGVLLVAVLLLWGGGPAPLPVPAVPDPLAEFVARETVPEDRLLIQSRDGYRFGGYEAVALPLALNREVIGCTFPRVWETPHFLRHMLWGRKLEEWTPTELRASLDRWGVSWVFTQTEEAERLVSATAGEASREAGRYRAFRVSTSPGRFLVGEGRVESRVNRLRLTELEPEEGLLVLRYRYHPAWRSESGVPIVRYQIPEDPVGFLAVENPPVQITLRLDPWQMLRAPWPSPHIAAEEVRSMP